MAENKTNKYESMTVAQLRIESKKRNMTLEYKGKKFTKAELIDRLLEDDDFKKYPDQFDLQTEKTEQKTMQTAEAESSEDDDFWADEMTDNAIKESETKTDIGWEVEAKDTQRDRISYVKTLDEIVEKYGKRKKSYVYDEELRVNSLVVFVHYVEAKNNEIYKKLRTGKVIGVNRKKELVKVVTLLGTEITLCFDDLLYIKSEEDTRSYPKDIYTFLRRQRTPKGREIIHERLAESQPN